MRLRIHKFDPGFLWQCYCCHVSDGANRSCDDWYQTTASFALLCLCGVLYCVLWRLYINLFWTLSLTALLLPCVMVIVIEGCDNNLLAVTVIWLLCVCVAFYMCVLTSSLKLSLEGFLWQWYCCIVRVGDHLAVMIVIKPQSCLHCCVCVCGVLYCVLWRLYINLFGDFVWLCYCCHV